MLKTSEKTSSLVDVARLYYEHDFSQQDIAKKLGISRPSVSRMLQKAREMGIIRIKIFDPEQRGSHQEKALQNIYGLKKVILVPNEDATDLVIKQRLGFVAARYLDELLEDGLTVGVSWGSTMQEVVKHLQHRTIRNMTVVQMNGGISRAEYDTHASEIALKIGRNYQAIPFLLPLPAIVDQVRVRKAIMSDKNISKTLNLAKEAQIAMYTIGAFSFNSVLVKADYFDKEEVEELLNDRAVGDVCSRIIDENGNICNSKLNARTIGIGLNELKKKKYAIAVAGGRDKFNAIRAGLRGKYFNVLITDEWVASKLLENTDFS
ncbi:MAG: sugar-binding transcriptional regulator [Calditrichaeota bacterium]|nr:sugar-binding transcriptional regulator [Calditrichota bacterium]